ncbi:hypothetical protein D915_006822 [Fasciola hepatica]|uniref:SOCS box domain-containing protein n=1 Tax=Fasciola hepatica TaxID=6192 RepID=A0A4E0RZC3_FASHE|nr:hypothetical protein D915_006822 [Fasciola hepatica]
MVAILAGDRALLEIRDAVFRDQADKIAPLLYNPAFSPEENRAEDRWIQQHTSFDVGFIWDRRYLSLLHVACMAAAEKCIRLLLDPPYSWNPNTLDGDGHCPVHYLVKANIPSVFYLAWKRSQQTYQPLSFDPKPFFWLIWPPKSVTELCGIISVVQPAKSLIKVAFPWQVGQEDRLECRVPFGLFLELCVSFEEKPSCNFWTAEWPIDNPRWFWPIPRPKPQTIPYHDEQCKEYPQCLDQLLAVNGNEIYTIPPCEAIYRLLVSIWAFHTLTEEFTEGGITYRVPRPPTLKRMCRFQIRRILTKRCGSKCDDQQETRNSNRTVPSYPQLVESFPLCDDLKSYLMYTDLWPTTVNILKPKTELVEARANDCGDLTFTGDEPFGFLL